MDYAITKGALKASLRVNKYILLTYHTGQTIGLNCKAVLNHSPHIDWDRNLSSQTLFTKIKPCDFMEYLTQKIPF